MLKWLITLAVVLFVLGLAGPLLAKMGFGRLPGDLRLRHRSREYHFPVVTSVILSLVLTLLLWALRI